jgi:hypothetical protein
MHPPPAVGLEHGRVVRSAGHVPDVPDDLLIVPAGREFRFPGPACPVPVPATPAVPVEDVPGAFGCNVQCTTSRDGDKCGWIKPFSDRPNTRNQPRQSTRL